MKRVLSMILLLSLCIGLCACAVEPPAAETTLPDSITEPSTEIQLSPKERLYDDVKKYISENFRIRIGDSVSESVSVDIASIVDKSENEWVVLGVYTIKIDNQTMSAAFGLVATYDKANNSFIYSQEEFDEFK